MERATWDLQCPSLCNSFGVHLLESGVPHSRCQQVQQLLPRCLYFVHWLRSWEEPVQCFGGGWSCTGCGQNGLQEPCAHAGETHGHLCREPQRGGWCVQGHVGGAYLYFSMQQEELKVQPSVTFSLNFFKEGVWAQQDLQDSVCRD